MTTLSHSIHTCSLGSVLVAFDSQYVHAVLPGNDAEAVTADWQCRYPAVPLNVMPASQNLHWAFIEEALETSKPVDMTRLNPAGTAFQQTVWAALGKIPAGSTTTYKALAAQMGRPAAVRAVANAVAANPIAVLIPCHRVIRSDGALSGYAWGTSLKEQLLKREGVLSFSGHVSCV